jgi:hypothetical protein
MFFVYSLSYFCSSIPSLLFFIFSCLFIYVLCFNPFSFFLNMHFFLISSFYHSIPSFVYRSLFSIRIDSFFKFLLTMFFRLSNSFVFFLDCFFFFLNYSFIFSSSSLTLQPTTTFPLTPLSHPSIKVSADPRSLRFLPHPYQPPLPGGHPIRSTVPRLVYFLLPNAPSSAAKRTLN